MGTRSKECSSCLTFPTAPPPPTSEIQLNPDKRKIFPTSQANPNPSGHCATSSPSFKSLVSLSSPFIMLYKSGTVESHYNLCCMDSDLCLSQILFPEIRPWHGLNAQCILISTRYWPCPLNTSNIKIPLYKSIESEYNCSRLYQLRYCSLLLLELRALECSMHIYINSKSGQAQNNQENSDSFTAAIYYRTMKEIVCGVMAQPILYPISSISHHHNLS